MIAKLSGQIVAIYEEYLVLNVGFMDWEVGIPEYTRRLLQDQKGKTISLFTIFYLDGNPVQGRLTPRLIGFQTELEREFFELFCSVDGVGTKKALRAMVRPVQEVATAIEAQDAKTLATLPGIGPATAERIIAKLRRKVPRFTLSLGGGNPFLSSDVLSQAFQALVALGHTETDARRKLEKATQKGKTFASVEELLQAVYQN